MTEKLTREEAIRLHRAMWNWIADVIEGRQCVQCIPDLKREYIQIRTLYTNVDCDCFCCEFRLQNQNTIEDISYCHLCPLDWGTDHEDFYPCEYRNGLWMQCNHSTDWKEQASLARKIANLPERAS